ncbi:hypothetical protein ES332_A06G167900v1 [Gossypium tomentosum]|uniref:RING-type E3 ubiquitin transferase n=1 Tax=Gossypium tomentosum TaxID=34277 RepID=A0A5D2Q5Z3_GOSTO|nr:hypothetical protein ES332_A06G167900v1 [Gossypium tomentosum]TYI23473.1 hypothetical protein ES332_A06G167900v1 [Gossypium tomentosum]
MRTYPVIQWCSYLCINWSIWASDTDVCCICFKQLCTIEVQYCGHQICAQCTVALCCHNKPNPITASLTTLVCPFCRCTIVRLMVAKMKCYDDTNCSTGEDSTSKPRKSKKPRNFSEGICSFKSLSAIGSFSKIGGRSSRRIAAENEWIDKT